jgi:hypothetical protein
LTIKNNKNWSAAIDSAALKCDVMSNQEVAQMTNEDVSAAGQRDRSPAYPIIPLSQALERLAQFEAHFKRSAARPDRVGDAWNMKAKAHAHRITAALRYFGLLEYQRNGSVRSVAVSDLGRNYLRAQQETVRRAIIAEVALKPRQIAVFWNLWGADRPADAACLDELVLSRGFSEGGARDFLKVYDATIGFAKPPSNAKIMTHQVIDDGDEEEDEVRDECAEESAIPPPSARAKQKAKIMEDERELTTGLLSKDASFRLIVSGQIGVKEIERLIQKLELDKDILADVNYEPDQWHFLSFTSDLAQQEVARFASALNKQFEQAGRPEGCKALRNEGQNGSQIIFLSSAASALVYAMPAYRPSLQSAEVFGEIDDSFGKSMKIFD